MAPPLSGDAGGVDRPLVPARRAPFDHANVTCSWVAPVVCAGGTSAVLKVGMPHMEGESEIEGLRFWNGHPTVQLLEADNDLGAGLLERCQPKYTLHPSRSTSRME